ncbi:predicted protein [Nematostella vectensis]|uniref:G-protein coupled receptors family 1 profile domain-containing protein n=1 Tax=Nematostella vectensis TaxID=45351 RepID=A7SC71_NEMVE|nr:predicted protein [Nematostella vectensis]|eukprot:XP_001630772.1 predicted protein [Nematostella vectensis]
MANPIIYSLRTQRFRLTLTLLLREPCGKSQPSMTSSSMVPSSDKAMSNNSNVTSPPPITQTTQAANHINTCSNSHSIIQISMIVVVMAVSIIGNGAVCALLLRFKTLRTVPNILVANLALIDVVNACVNMPLFIMWYQCKVPYIGGPAVSWFTISFYVLFMNLTVVSLVVLMLDRYGAIVHGLRYHSWKTRNKALFSVFVIWFCACAYTYGQFAMGIHVDIGPQPAWMYRMEYFKIFGRPFVLTGKQKIGT